MGKSLAQQESVFIEALKMSTGKDLNEWITIIGKTGLSDRKSIRDWLQNTGRIGYIPAHKLSFLYLEIIESMKPKISFTSSGRSGKVIYQDRESSFSMYYEFGGKDVLAIVDIPVQADWETCTSIPLEKRAATLDFIGREIVRAQTDGRGSFEIMDSHIIIRL